MTDRRAKGRAREELVLEAAGQAIAELGLANVRVADVAERADMTPGHVTYYFPSKTHLLIRAIRDSEEELVATAEAELSRIGDPWKRLDRLVELSASQGKGDPGWVLWFDVWSGAAVDPEIAKVSNELDSRWRTMLADVIQYGCHQGAFATVDPQRTAFLLSALIDGLSIQLTVGASPFTRVELLRFVRTAARAHLLPR